MFPTLSFGDQEFTPSDLAKRSAKAAGVLASIGIAEGDTFAVMLRNSPTLIEIMLAARQIGAYFVALNWHFKAQEAGYILRDSGAKALIIHGDLLSQDIIDRYQVLVANPPYFKELSKLVAALRGASTALTAAADVVMQCPIEAADWSAINDIPGDLLAEIAGDRVALLRRMHRDANAYNDLAWAINLCTEPDAKHKSKRLIPECVYDNATNELIERYEQLTETRVVSPQPLHKGQPQQHSTAFVTSCLQQIDPACTPKMAITCIKNARESRKTGIPGVQYGGTFKI